MWLDWVSNLGPLALESDVLPTALSSLARTSRSQKLKPTTLNRVFLCRSINTWYCNTSSLRDASITFTWCDHVAFNNFPRCRERYVPGILAHYLVSFFFFFKNVLTKNPKTNFWEGRWGGHKTAENHPQEMTQAL